MSGAGKKSVENKLSAELKNNFYSYCVTSHKHFPEIDQEIKKVNKNISFTFVPIAPLACFCFYFFRPGLSTTQHFYAERAWRRGGPDTSQP